jgi:hypothetical protein
MNLKNRKDLDDILPNNKKGVEISSPVRIFIDKIGLVKSPSVSGTA